MLVCGYPDTSGAADLSDKMMMDMIKKDMQARAVSVAAFFYVPVSSYMWCVVRCEGKV